MSNLWVLGGLLVAVWALVVFFFRVNRIWLFYYLVGAVGLAFLIIFVGRATEIQSWMETGVAYTTFGLLNLVNVPARVFEAAPGALMFFVVSQAVEGGSGWTMVEITIECSSLLESGVIAGMVGFYPGWSLRRRMVLVLIGVAATYAANIVRLSVILGTLHFFGKDALFIAHTVVGRVVFFVLVVAIFWYIITLPTLGSVSRKLKEDMAT